VLIVDAFEVINELVERHEAVTEVNSSAGDVTTSESAPVQHFQQRTDTRGGVGEVRRRTVAWNGDDARNVCRLSSRHGTGQAPVGREYSEMFHFKSLFRYFRQVA